MSIEWQGKSLYHYTDFFALQGIIENHEIWLNNIKCMNDTKEIWHLIETIEKAVLDECCKQKEKVKNLFFNQKTKLDPFQIYSFSLTSLKNDAAQWERYGGHGAGVCLEFDAKKLNDIMWKNYNLYIQEVFYTESAEKHQATDEIVSYIKTGHTKRDWGGIDLLFTNILACATAHKHPSFESEREYRINTSAFSQEKLKQQLNYRMEQWGIREYYTLKLEDDETKFDGLLKKIKVGPKADKNIDILKRYLEAKGFDNITDLVEISDCPLR